MATLSTQATLAEAVELMAVGYATHVLATDPSSGAPAGIISSLDIAAAVGGVPPRPARTPLAAPGPAVTERADAERVANQRRDAPGRDHLDAGRRAPYRGADHG